jgi:pimeloyl-ACP methyl ester carboxylesterase
VQFTLTSAEGLPIRGNLDVPGEAESLVIVLHGFKGFKDWAFFPWVANWLVEQRIAVCRYNTSRSGVGEDLETFDQLDLFADDTFTVQLSDLRIVVEHAQDRLRVPTFLLGHSRGGGVAILGAGEVPNLRGVIGWNPIAHADRWDDATKAAWRRQGFTEFENSRTKQKMRLSTRVLDDLPNHDILGAARNLKVPLLVLHGGRDDTVAPSEAIELAAAAPHAEKIMIRSATHTFNAVHPFKRTPRQLSLATAITQRFVAGYSEE